MVSAMVSTKWSIVFLVAVTILLVPSTSGARSPLLSFLGGAKESKNGGIPCAACTILLGLVDQLAEIYNTSEGHALDMFCSFLPAGGFRDTCKVVVDEFGPAIVVLLAEDFTSDTICHAIGICTMETGEFCHLYPHKSVGRLDLSMLYARKRALDARGRRFEFPDLCNISTVKPLCELIIRYGEDNLPLEDLDDDFFSRLTTLRGTSWRGKDCDDTKNGFHAGKVTTDDEIFDTNCNGIYGYDVATGKSFEEQWCANTGQMGTIALGDSFTAHFRIPQEWATAADLNEPILKDLPFALENEFDWPMMSTTTGYKNSTWDVIQGPVDSIYLRLRELNLCNHRDYQNIGVNGDDSNLMAGNTMYTMARNRTVDHPALISLALLGNDVCNEYHDTDHMTTPEQFYANQLKALTYLDKTVPAGSLVLALGLVDGRFLYDTMHERIHPLGAWRKDVTYPEFYEFLNCLYISPCFGWLNTDASWRNKTAARVKELNSALKGLVENVTFTNIKVHYMEFPLPTIVDRWRAMGGLDWQLIQPVDGFHPSQEAVALFTDVLWKQLAKDIPEYLPPANPNNAKILERFHDQGGY